MKATIACDGLIDSNSVLVPKFANFSHNSSTTDGSVVAAVAGKKIRVVCGTVSTGGGTTSFQFNTKPGGAGTKIAGSFTVLASTSLPFGFCPLGHFETAVGEGLSFTSGAGSAVSGNITYVEV